MTAVRETVEWGADQKSRWGGLLENPFVSRIQRNVLDLGRMREFGALLARLDFQEVLDLGCGYGAAAQFRKGRYCGLDNSWSNIHYAALKQPSCHFLAGNATQLPFQDKTFDLVLLLDTAHHFTDAQLQQTLQEAARVSRSFIIVGDPLIPQQQGVLSRFFYGLDRGGCFRDLSQMRAVFAAFPGLTIEQELSFWTFPKLYFRGLFLLSKVN